MLVNGKFNWYKANLYGLVLALTLLLALVDADSHQAKAKKPLFVTRRRHDPNFLQLLSPYQQPLPYEELTLERRLEINQSNEAGHTQAVNVSYYVNDELEADEITYDHLIVGSFHHTYVSRMFKAYMYNYNSKEDRRKSSDKRLVSRKWCERDLRYLVDNLPGKKKNISPELAAFYDSYGHPEPGLLYGNFYWLGTPSQCIQRLIIEPDHHNQSNSIVFKGRHCRASIRSSTWNKLIENQRNKLSKAGNFFKYEGQVYDYERFFRIQVGICLPQSCDSESVEWGNEQIKELAMHNFDDSHNKFELLDLFCPPDETSELRKIEPMGRLLILLYALWLSAMCVATFFDHRNQEEAKQLKSYFEKFISSMSFKRNWRRLVSLKETPEPVFGAPALSDLTFMNCFKASFAPLVICCHTALLIFEYRKVTNIYQSPALGWFYHLFMSGIFFVDGFFFFSGFASAYIMFQQRLAERFKLYQWLYLIFHRYWRLVGLYAIVVWYAKHVQVYTNYGPTWDYATGNTTHRALCRAQSWWYPLTLSSNFNPMHDDCVITSWYQSNDMQFFLVTPFIILALHKWPRATWLTSMGAIWLGVLLYFRTFYNSHRISHLQLARLTDDTPSRMLWDMDELYQRPWYRFAPYLMGLLGGHYTYMVLSGQWKSIFYRGTNSSSNNAKEQSTNWPLRLLLILSLVPFCCMSFSKLILDNIDLSESGEQVRFITSLTYSIRHINAGIGLFMMSVSIMFGAAPGMRRFMSNPLWAMAARLNYAILLIQVEVIWYLFLGREYTISFDEMEFITFSVTVWPFCYLISIILTLTLSQPLAKLEQEFVSRAFSRDKNQSEKRQQEQQQIVHDKKLN